MLSINLKTEKTSSAIKKRNINVKEMSMKAFPNKRLLYTNSFNFSDLHRWQNITNLILSNSNISSLPTELGLLPFLRMVNLSHNYLAQSKWTWLEQATIKKNLIELDISDTSLLELPLQIAKLNTLKCLKACFNKLVDLPQSIGMLQNLKELYLSHNNSLLILPATLKFLGLKCLDISEILFINMNDAYNILQININNYNFNSAFEKKWKIPTLKELSAKKILRSRIPYDTNLPLVLVKYLDEANYCCICKEACIDIHELAQIVTNCIMLEEIIENILVCGVPSSNKGIILDSYFCSQSCSRRYNSHYFRNSDDED